MPVPRQDRSNGWPFMALHSRTVAGTEPGQKLSRGELLRRARNLRRISRRELAELTGVGARTIGRIETGNAGDNTRSTEVLERALAPELATITDAPPAPSGRLDQFSDLDLLAELGRRLEERRRQAEAAPTPPAGHGGAGVEVGRTADAPSARRAAATPNG